MTETRCRCFATAPGRSDGVSPPTRRRPTLPAREEYGAHGGESAPEEALPWAPPRSGCSRPGTTGSPPCDATVARTRRRSGPSGRRGGLYFTTSPETTTARNLASPSDAVVHTESGSEVVIVEGRARRLQPEDVPAAVVDAYEEKYGWRLDPGDPGDPGCRTTCSIRGWRGPGSRRTSGEPRRDGSFRPAG